MDKKTKLNKKGVFGLQQQFLSYAVVILVLSVAASILISLKDTTSEAYGQSANRSITIDSSGNFWIPGHDQVGARGYSIVSLYNATNHSISSTNWVLNETLGFVHLKSGASQAGQFVSIADVSSVNLSYSFTTDSLTAAYNSTIKGIAGTSNFSNQMPLLATILVFVAIISAVVFLANAFRRA